MRAVSSAFILGALLLGQVPSAGGAPSVDKLTAGAASDAGASRVTGDGGATYELRGGATVRLSPGSVFGFEPSIRLKLRKPGDPETLTRQLRLDKGSVEVSIPASKGEPTAVLVRSSSKLSGVVKEGRATYVVQGDRATAASREGEMLVGIGNEWKALPAGFARTLAPEDPMAAPRPVPVAPTLTADHALVVVQSGEKASLSARWPAVADASSYDVVLQRITASGPVAVNAWSTSDARASLDGVAPGTYAVFASTVDRYGLASALSSPVALRVLGVELPEGGLLTDDGTILLGKDQRVLLHGADGVEVSYGTSPVFIPAPKALGLSRLAETRVRLRARGETAEAELRLAPKGLRAKVELSPRTARWPDDRVVVSIELYDASGRPVPETAKVTAEVTVNSTPSDVKWERSGRMLRAVLPSSLTEGPWVVRAEVRDARGELLGRDFLEIAPAPHRATVAQR